MVILDNFAQKGLFERHGAPQSAPSQSFDMQAEEYASRRICERVWRRARGTGERPSVLQCAASCREGAGQQGHVKVTSRRQVAHTDDTSIGSRYGQTADSADSCQGKK
jgi:hypothetical protein